MLVVRRETNIKAVGNAGVHLYHNNIEKAYTNSQGLYVTNTSANAFFRTLAPSGYHAQIDMTSDAGSAHGDNYRLEVNTDQKFRVYGKPGGNYTSFIELDQAGKVDVTRDLDVARQLETSLLKVTGVSTFRDAVLINRSTSNEGLRFELNGGYKGGLTAASNEFRVTSNGSKDLLLGSNNAGGNSGDVVIASVGAGNSYSTGWGRMAVFGGTGTAELYYQDVKKLETTGVGATVFGTTETQQLNVSGVSTLSGDVSFASTVRIPDDTKLLIGDANAGFSTIGGSGGLELYHNASGTSSIVHKSNSNSLFIQGKQIRI